jgi:hypothetical protein
VTTPDEARNARALGLLAALATAGSQGHTDATLGQRVADVLGEALPLSSVELHAGERVRVFTPSRSAPGRVAYRESLEVTAEEGGGALVLAFAAPRELLADEVGWSEAWREALARVIAADFAQARALARVAALSRKAHGERARLQGDLERAALSDETATSGAMRRLWEEAVPLVATQDVTVLLRGAVGHGEGAGGAAHPRALAAGEAALRAGQRGGAAGDARQQRPLRTREGRVHRGDAAARGHLRARPRRDAPAGRGRRPRACDAGAAAAGVAGG